MSIFRMNSKKEMNNLPISNYYTDPQQILSFDQEKMMNLLDYITIYPNEEDSQSRGHKYAKAP